MTVGIPAGADRLLCGVAKDHARQGGVHSLLDPATAGAFGALGSEGPVSPTV